MRIDLNRLSKLAGLPASSSSRRSLREGKGHEEEAMEEMTEMEDLAFMDEVMYEEETEEGMHYEGMYEEETEEGMHYEGKDKEDKEDMEEMIEVDEAMLVQELRKSKKNHARKISVESNCQSLDNVKENKKCLKHNLEALLMKKFKMFLMK